MTKSSVREEEHQGDERGTTRSRVTPFLAVTTVALGLCLLAAWLGPPGEATLTLPSWLGGGLVLPAGWFILLFPALLATSLAAVLFFPRGLSLRRAIVVIVAVAAAARSLLLPLPASDDVHRYLWEGRVLAAGLSPYSHPPRAENDPEADPLRDPADHYWRGINHPEMTAIYPPGMLLLLAAVATVSYDTTAVKVVMIGADLATLVLLLLLLADRRDSARWALLWALNPVVLFAFAGEGHNDAFQVFGVVAALYLWRRGRWGWMWLILGLAVQAKYIAVLAWPFFLTRESWRWLWIGLLVAVGPVLAFLALDGGALFESFLAFGFNMAFNGPIQTALRTVTGSNMAANILCQLSFVTLFWVGLFFLHPSRRSNSTRIWGRMWLRVTDPVPGLLVTFGLFLVLSPTVHFWYLTWLLPLVVLRPAASWLVLSATIGVTFVTYGLEFLTGTWAFPSWGLWAVWAVPLGLLAWELRRGLRRWWSGRRADQQSEDVPMTVTVIIPTVDEADRIEDCLAAVWRSTSVTQVVVVDAGSTDGTRALAEAAGAEVIEHLAPPHDGGGRGGQIAAGVARARGDVIALVHADTLVAQGALDEALNALAADPEVVGGALGSCFDGPGVVLRLVEAANDMRAALLGVSFGDQVQFFRRNLLLRFPAIPLMEDVELSLLLGAFGRRTFRWGECRVSPRRWRRGSSGARILLVIGLSGEYLLRRVFGQVDTVGMYRRYYHR